MSIRCCGATDRTTGSIAPSPEARDHLTASVDERQSGAFDPVTGHEAQGTGVSSGLFGHRVRPPTGHAGRREGTDAQVARLQHITADIAIAAIGTVERALILEIQIDLRAFHGRNQPLPVVPVGFEDPDIVHQRRCRKRPRRNRKEPRDAG